MPTQSAATSPSTAEMLEGCGFFGVVSFFFLCVLLCFYFKDQKLHIRLT